MKYWTVGVEIPCVFVVEVQAETEKEALKIAVERKSLRDAELVETDYSGAFALYATEEPA